MKSPFVVVYCVLLALYCSGCAVAPLIASSAGAATLSMSTIWATTESRRQEEAAREELRLARTKARTESGRQVRTSGTGNKAVPLTSAGLVTPTNVPLITGPERPVLAD